MRLFFNGMTTSVEKIFIISDTDAFHRAVFRKHLEDIFPGCTVYETASAAEIERICSEEFPDTVYSEIMLSDKSIDETGIKEKGIVVIIVTGYRESISLMKDPYNNCPVIQKPVRPEHIAAGGE